MSSWKPTNSNDGKTGETPSPRQAGPGRSELFPGRPGAGHGERFLKIGGVVTRVLEAGVQDAPTLVLLHDGAWGGSSDVTWGACLPQLAEHFHIIAPDFLGFGGSDKAAYFDRSSYTPRIDQVESVLAALMVNDIHLVGSSYGGSVALRMLAESRMPIQSATSIGGTGGSWKTEVMLRELGRWDGTRTDLARVLSLLMDESHPGFETQLARREYWASAPGHYRALASAALPLPDPLKQAVDDDWPSGLAGTEIPVLLLAGREDALFDAEWPERLRQHLPQAAIARMDTRHSPNLDHPQEVAEMIIRFVRAAADSNQGISHS